MKKHILIIFCLTLMFTSCTSNQEKQTASDDDFKFLVEQFADLRIMRYQVPDFESLSLKQKELIYYLSEAALAGRDILFDQNYKYNLTIRRTLENIYENYSGPRNTPEFEKYTVYLKRVWFSNGIHHHYSKDKFYPEISEDYFKSLIAETSPGNFPLKDGQTIEAFTEEITPIIFSHNIAPKAVSQAAGEDLLLSSACNFYDGVTEKEAEDYYKAKKAGDIKTGGDTLVSYGLNSKLVKRNGKIFEEVYKTGGLYSPAIEKIIFWLEKAAGVAENDLQQRTINTLIEYYKTGDLKTWDEYNVLWVGDMQSEVDFINGFIEVYGDPLGLKATWESLVNFKDHAATKRATIISENAQWFEDNSPVNPKFKKAEVKGVSAKVITAAQLGGDCYPSTPIGINLPNADWIRKEHGSKSVTIENITYAYDQASLGNGMLEEFAANDQEIALAREYGSLASNLHTDLHECLGHGSGQLLPGTRGDELKNYGSPLEEARADLFALYYIGDPKMISLGLFDDEKVYMAEYNSYIRNGLITQLTRIEPGKNIEQAHMRNRQLIASWAYEQGKADNVIEKFSRDGKSYVKINDYKALRQLFGKLLAEIQRIKSEGDYEAGRDLVEKYGVKVNPELHREVLDRFAKLNIAPYGGFINPVFVPVTENGKITSVNVEYPEDYAGQMMDYSKNHSFLPSIN
ncbi:MAG: dipeptidyl peptidase 3 [Lentimicrobium sp.]|nr:dipeptidyl peptidase 3 [Lentimicrobium sp.]MDD2526771.1 dihydrofolate reductase [Lentimicrobiaceae bacterium]MDD4596495.1 dihydrofolate reductase [Lentimicrobiaceae bacterium]MDY0024737.1 dihydrofolate reductase [Lentimicrobium sp.]